MPVNAAARKTPDHGHRRPSSRPRKEYPTYRGMEAVEILRETGILWRINQATGHPLGLVLGFEVDEQTGQATLVVTDHREHPTTIFSEKEYREAEARFKAYMRGRGRETMELRKAALGFHAQPSPDKE